MSNTCRQRDRDVFQSDIKYLLVPKGNCWTPGDCCDSTYHLNQHSLFQTAGNQVVLGRERENLWLLSRSSRPVMEAVKILYCCHILVSLLREKHWNSVVRKSHSELAGKRMINQPEGGREGWLEEEWKKGGCQKEGGYQNQAESEGIGRQVRRARKN